MLLAIDVDGTVADLHGEWLRCYNFDYNDTLTAEQCTEWELVKFVKPECGYKIFDYLKHHALYDNVHPIEGALEGINMLRGAGHRIVFVTSSNRLMSGRKLAWLCDHGFLPESHRNGSRDYVECTDKSLIRADVLIDDYHVNIEGFVGHKILFDQPWNQDWKSPFPAMSAMGVARAAHWHQVYDLINSMRQCGWIKGWDKTLCHSE